MLDPHRWLLSDRGRTLAFRDAIHQLVRPGDVVVDLGSGSGILAFFAAEAGAARVYAIEQEHIADVAALVARHNNYHDRVVLLHEYSLKATVPEKANVLITETLGNFGFDEQIAGLTLDARERYLTPDAILIPRRVVLHTVPVELPDIFERHIDWWSESRYGVDLKPVRTFASNMVYSTDVPERAHLATPSAIIDVDLTTIETSDASGHSHFTATRDGIFHGFGGWFSATLAPGLVISNPNPHDTHWQQVFLPVEHPVEVHRGDAIDLELQTHDGRAWRWRGRAAGREFDQTTGLAAPPCTLLGSRG
jgi:protein arginine N-methyltransferase 1